MVGLIVSNRQGCVVQYVKSHLDYCAAFRRHSFRAELKGSNICFPVNSVIRSGQNKPIFTALVTMNSASAVHPLRESILSQAEIAERLKKFLSPKAYNSCFGNIARYNSKILKTQSQRECPSDRVRWASILFGGFPSAVKPSLLPGIGAVPGRSQPICSQQGDGPHQYAREDIRKPRNV